MSANLTLRVFPEEMSVCRLRDFTNVNMQNDFFFLARTDEEYSLVCKSTQVPADIEIREDGWRALRIEGILDFSLVGILAKIASLLAEEQISIFAVSTFNTDYILLKEDQLEKAICALKTAGYDIVR